MLIHEEAVAILKQSLEIKNKDVFLIILQRCLQKCIQNYEDVDQEDDFQVINIILFLDYNKSDAGAVLTPLYSPPLLSQPSPDLSCIFSLPHQRPVHSTWTNRDFLSHEEVWKAKGYSPRKARGWLRVLFERRVSAYGGVGGGRKLG